MFDSAFDGMLNSAVLVYSREINLCWGMSMLMFCSCYSVPLDVEALSLIGTVEGHYSAIGEPL